MSLLVFDAVVVGIGYNPYKSHKNQLFSLEQRIRMTKESLQEYGSRIKVGEFSGTAIDFAADVGATVIVRGIRNDMDGAVEASMSYANLLMSEIEIGRTIPTFHVLCRHR